MAHYNSQIALLGGCIDYAGTFPPAALSLSDALRKAASFRASAKHPWLMGKLALPIADLKKISARTLFESGADGSAWIFTALGSFGKDAAASDFARSLEWDLREIRRCNDRGVDASCRQWIVAYETRLPTEVGLKTESAPLYDFLAPLLDRFGALTRGQLAPYFEVPWGGDWRRAVPAVADALARWVDANGDAQCLPGIKIRTGGTFVPASEQIAAVVAACVARGLRFKATQGLHHAVTSRDEKGREAHGFVNLFVALALAQTLGAEVFGPKEIARCLSEVKAEAFRFKEQDLSYLDRTVDCDAIEAARRQHAASFGSCSVDEPDQFLAEAYPDETR